MLFRKITYDSPVHDKRNLWEKKNSSNVIKKYYMTIVSDHQTYCQIMIKTAIFLSAKNKLSSKSRHLTDRSIGGNVC